MRGVWVLGSIFGVPGGVLFEGGGLLGPFFWEGSQEGSGSHISGLGTLLLGFLAVLGYFWAFCRKNAVFDVLGLKCSKMSVFFIENNFWNNISARDVSPFRCSLVYHIRMA